MPWFGEMMLRTRIAVVKIKRMPPINACCCLLREKDGDGCGRLRLLRERLLAALAFLFRDCVVERVVVFLRVLLLVVFLRGVAFLLGVFFLAVVERFLAAELDVVRFLAVVLDVVRFLAGVLRVDLDFVIQNRFCNLHLSRKNGRMWSADYASCV